MTASSPSLQRSVLWFLFCTALLLPGLSHARNGDDWVLVERFKSQMKKAQAGNPDAMYEVARMYERGRGTAPDIQQAVHWFEKAVAKGKNNARAQLGALYLSGKGVRRDLGKAWALLRAAAEKGNATAQYNLAQMYEHGEGVRHDLNQARYWYKKAAGNGYYLAVNRLKTLKQPPGNVQQGKRSRPTSSDSPAQILMRTVLQTKWQHAGQPSAFLPSANTRCQQSKGGRSVICKSGIQKRKSYDAVIDYSTEATLSGFNNTDVFRIHYVNTVLKVKPIVRRRVEGDQSTPRRPPNIPLGKQRVTHQLRCKLKSVNQLVCTKDKNLVVTYTGEK